MVPTSTLLMHLAEMMNRLKTDRHPQIEAFLERHKNNPDFQLLACTARGLWRSLNSRYEPIPTGVIWTCVGLALMMATAFAAFLYFVM